MSSGSGAVRHAQCRLTAAGCGELRTTIDGRDDRTMVGGSVGMRRISIDGNLIAYERVGDGPVLVLLHGFLLDSRSWRPQLEGLADHYTVIAWDAPGAGESDDPPRELAIEDWADALAALLDAEGCERAHVAGLSWGGLLAQVFFQRHRARVSSLVLADSYAGWTGSLGSAVAEMRLGQALTDAALPPAELVAKYLPGMFSDSAS